MKGRRTRLGAARLSAQYLEYPHPDRVTQTVNTHFNRFHILEWQRYSPNLVLAPRVQVRKKSLAISSIVSFFSQRRRPALL